MEQFLRLIYLYECVKEDFKCQILNVKEQYDDYLIVCKIEFDTFNSFRFGLFFVIQ